MPLWLVLVLGVVQGLTEFLPVSSDGHLRLMSALMGIAEPQTQFDVSLHAGTLLAVIWGFRADLRRMFLGLFRLTAGLGRGQTTSVWRTDADARLAVLTVVATVPTGIFGMIIGHWSEAYLATPFWVACGLTLNGLLLYAGGQLSRRARPFREIAEVRVADAVLIGLLQSFAVLRGVSRSGTTIVAGLALGLSPDAAARFSFLASIPVIAVASGYEWIRHKPGAGEIPVSTAALLLGVAVAALVGLAALRALLHIVRAGRLDRFAWYCWAVAAVVFVALACGAF